MMRFSKVLIVLCASALLFSMLACNQSKQQSAESTGQAATPQPAATQPAAPKDELSGKVVIWSWDVALKALQFAGENFKKLHPNVEFQFEDMGTEQVYNKMLTGLASNTGLPDVVSLEAAEIPKYVSKFPNGFVDLTAEVNTADFLPVKIAECTFNGKVLAYPWDAAPCAVFYRKDLFEKAGINPDEIKTWDDFIKAGTKLKKATGVKMLPIAVSRNPGMFRILLNQLGSFYFDEQGYTVLNNKTALTAMTYIQKMYKAGIVHDSVNWDGLVTSAKESKVATVVNAVWWAGTLQDECKNLAGNWRVMKLPVLPEGSVSAAVNGGSNLLVPAITTNKAAAVAFVKFAMTDTACLVKGFADYGLYPSYIPLYADPVFGKEVEYFGGQKIWSFFQEIGKNIPKVNYSDNFDQVDNMVADAQAKVTLKNQDVKATLEKLQEAVVAKIGK